MTTASTAAIRKSEASETTLWSAPPPNAASP